jgi:CRP/FNR family cyclic AMP-dependent transcriptional regulator
VAIASNLAFIAYGYLGELMPVLLLHLLLLPVNLHRLTELGSAQREDGSGRNSRA